MGPVNSVWDPLVTQKRASLKNKNKQNKTQRQGRGLNLNAYLVFFFLEKRNLVGRYLSKSLFALFFFFFFF